MQVYVFDNTLDGLLTAVFDSFFLHQQPEFLLAEGEQLPLFADEPHRVVTDSGKAERVWKGLEKHLSKDGLHMITISWFAEERSLNQPLFNFICKVFQIYFMGAVYSPDMSAEIKFVFIHFFFHFSHF